MRRAARLRRRRRPAHRRVDVGPHHRLRPRRHRAPRRPVPARPHPARRSPPPAADAARLRPVPSTTARWSSGRRPTCRTDPLAAAARRCRRRARRPAHRADDPDRTSPPARPPLPEPVARRSPATCSRDLLATGPGLVAVWEGLDQAGVVERWIPEWAAVRSPPAAQRRAPAHRRPAPHRDRRARRAAWCAASRRPDLLLLAALLHDIGKVPGAHDHSATGAPLADSRAAGGWASPTPTARPSCGWCASTSPSSTWPPVATTRTRRRSTRALGRRRRLGDDLRPAARPHRGRRVRRRAQGLDRLAGHAARQRAHQACRAALDRAHPRRRPLVAEPIETLVLGRDDLDRIASGEPCVVVSSPRRAYRIDVFDRDRLGLFADTAGLLAAHGLVVRTAILRTIDGVAANEWHVETPSGETPHDRRIVRGLERRRAGRPRAARACWSGGASSRGSEPAASGSPARRAPGRAAARPTTATVIEVRAQDRPGLLHELGHRASPGRVCRCAPPTSPRMPGRPSTRSTSPSSVVGRCRRPGSRRRSPMVIDTCDAD